MFKFMKTLRKYNQKSLQIKSYHLEKECKDPELSMSKIDGVDKNILIYPFF